MKRNSRPLRGNHQRGFAIMVLLALLAVGILYAVISLLDPDQYKAGRAGNTDDALAQAKAALIGYAATYRDGHGNQVFGYLPCPDIDGDGSAEALQADCGGTDGKAVVGLLPYKQLGLPSNQDADGNCLWYAVSGSFKASATGGSLPSPMNWDTQGQLEVRDKNDVLLVGPNDANGGAAAVIFSVGPPQPGQSRPPATPANPCGVSSTTKANAVYANYIEVDPTKVNRSLSEPFPGPAYGTVRVVQGNIGSSINNDRLLSITPKEIFDEVIKRADFGISLAALSNEIKVQIENKTSSSAYLANANNSMPTKVTGELAAGLVTNASQVGYFNNWSNQYRLVLCPDVNTPCLQINDGSGTPNCAGALMFGGRSAANQNSSGIAAGQPRQSGWMTDVRYFFESAGGALGLFTDPAAFAFSGNLNYDRNNPSADIGYCLFPKPFNINLNAPGTAAAFASGTVGGGNAVATVTTSTPAITLGNATAAAGSGCVWYPATIPVGTNTRIYFRYQVSTFGPGFTLALADAATNNPANTSPIMCGASSGDPLGYAGAPTTGTATNNEAVPPVVAISSTDWSPATGLPTTGLATITTTRAQVSNLPGQLVIVAGAYPEGYNGTFKIISVTSPYSFTYAVTNPGPASAGINPPKTAIEFDMHCDPSRNDPPPGCGTPPPHHYAFDYWGFASDNDPAPSSTTRDGSDDVTHNNGVAGNGSQPLNPRTYPITFATATPVASIAAAQWSGGISTITTTAPHGLAIGQSINIADVSPLSFKGAQTVATVPDANHFTYSYSAPATNPGPYPYVATVSAASWSSGIATITTSAAHGLTVGQSYVVTLANISPSSWNGTYAVTVSDATHITYALANPGAYVSGGQMSYPPSKIVGTSWASGTATVTTVAPHGLFTNQYVTVSGISPTGYDGVYRITITNPTRFTYSLASNPGGYISGGMVSLVPVLHNILNASSAGNTATITTRAAHGLATGQYVTISGVSPGGYNGTYAIIAGLGDPTQFTYTIARDPGSFVSGGNVGYGSGGMTSMVMPSVVTSSTISSASWSPASGGTVTIDTMAAHSLATGQIVNIAGIYPAGYNGAYPVAVSSTTRFTYALASDPGGSFSTGGTSTTVFATPGVATTTMPTGTDIHVRLDLSRNYNVATHQATLTMKAYIGNPTSFCLTTTGFKNLSQDLPTICPAATATIEQDGIVINDVVGPAMTNIYLGFTNSRGALSSDNQQITIYDLLLRSQ